MLINATQQEELRVAMVDGQYLYDLDIERTARQRKKSNIYKGKITRVEPSLEAAFVNYGEERHGFLPFKEISRSYFNSKAKDDNGRYNIKDAIKEGQEVLVQIDKEERGSKGAALTTFISLAGRYLVMMPNNPRAGGVSRRIEGDERNQVRDALRELNMVDGSGVIVRTAGVGRSSEELQWDLDYLTQVWTAIDDAAKDKPAPFLIYSDSNIIVRTLRDNYRNDIGEILIDSPAIYEEARDFVKQVMPHNLDKLKLYKEETPLFNRFQIESQIESAFGREVRLPSGGEIVMDHTEALISIDINSGRATKGSDIEETALNTNLEAADEIARQLRLRDSGGLVVIDFIDMGSNRNQRAVEERLRKALSVDRARVQIGRISRFGLLEMSRQRLRSSLGESSYGTCPRCSGQGTIRSVDSLALSILRLIEEETMKDTTGRVIAQVPVSVATFLLNEKRRAISLLEGRHKAEILLIPNATLETPHFEISRERTDEAGQNTARSYAQAGDFTRDEARIEKEENAAPIQTPVVRSVEPAARAPERSQQASAKSSGNKDNSGGLIKRLFGSIFGGEKPEEEKDNKARGNRQGNRGRGNGQRGGRRQNNRNRNRNRNRNNSNRTNNDRQQGNRDSSKQNAKAENASDSREKKTNDKPQQNRNRNRNRNNQSKQRAQNIGDGNQPRPEANGNQIKPEQASVEDGNQASDKQPSGGQSRRGRRRGSRAGNRSNQNRDAAEAQDKNQHNPAAEQATSGKSDNGNSSARETSASREVSGNVGNSSNASANTASAAEVNPSAAQSVVDKAPASTGSAATPQPAIEKAPTPEASAPAAPVSTPAAAANQKPATATPPSSMPTDSDQ